MRKAKISDSIHFISGRIQKQVLIGPQKIS